MDMDEKDSSIQINCPQIRSIIEDLLQSQRQDLKHLIYPLNYSSKTADLIHRQEMFVELYERDWKNWCHVGILGKIPRGNESFDVLALLKILLILFIGESGYDSRTRILLLGLAQRLKITEEVFVTRVEEAVLKDLLQDDQKRMKRSLSDRTEDGNSSSEASGSGRSSTSSWSRRKWMYATAGVFVGAAACSLTAGLAAPIFMPAFLSAAGITGAAFLAGGGGVALMATLFGIAGAGMASYRVSRRFRDLKDFRFIPLKDADRNRKMRVCVAISGWIKNESDFTGPWIEAYLENESAGLAIQSEVYCLAFEKDIMISLGRAMQDFIKSSAVTIAASEVIKYTVTAAASSALLFPVAVLQAGDLVDNPWTLGLDRARKAGKALAEALKRGAQGHRPVTLIGYSLGALVIFTCLQELARAALQEVSDEFSDSLSRTASSEDLHSVHTDDGLVSSSVGSPLPQNLQVPSSYFGIIENVVLMGLPLHLPAPSVWNQLRHLVSGRFVHCYSRSDWVLRFLYRTSSPTASDIAGLGPIQDSPSIENVDLSDLVLGHSDYQTKISEIISLVNL